jgi:hypothetical protein
MRQDIREALRGFVIGVSVGSAVAFVFVSQCGCVLDWTPPDDADAEQDTAEDIHSDIPEDDSPATDDDGDGAETPRSLCDDSCNWPWSLNEACEDGGPGSASHACPLGTDCSDCGPRYLYDDGDIAP